MTIPSLLVDIATSGPEAIEELAKGTKGVLFGGAAMPDKLGDFLTENGVNIFVGYGM
jgi:long-subunit acyl-CoA synthetase (AMP-forming)